MRLVSQNERTDIPYEQFALEHIPLEDTGVKAYIVARSVNSPTYTYYMAEYSSDEEAASAIRGARTAYKLEDETQEHVFRFPRARL